MCRRWTAEDKRADGGDGTVEGAHGCVGGGLPEWTAVTVLKKVTEVTVVETLWPLPLLLSVSVEAGWWRQTVWRWLMATEVTEVSKKLTDASQVDCRRRHS